MNHDYEDIRARVASPPVWFDEAAVPRWEPFSPGVAANIYARQCCLLGIECQACHARFLVCMSSDTISGGDLSRQITIKTIHYGDPPNIGCCPGGPTMNSEPHKVIEYWERHTLRSNQSEWTRLPAYEIDVTPDWVVDESCT